MADREYVSRELLDAALRALSEAQRQLDDERVVSKWLQDKVDGDEEKVGGTDARCTNPMKRNDDI